MELKIYTVRDSKAGFYGPPFYLRTHGEAERTFQQLANDPKTNVFTYPEDYDLYHLGEFDDQTGKANIIDTPQHIIKAVALKTAN